MLLAGVAISFFFSSLILFLQYISDFTDTFRNRIHRFLEQVDQGVAPDDIDGSGADGLAAQKVLAAAIESLENETVVYIR
jgi:hypothetical protein